MVPEKIDKADGRVYRMIIINMMAFVERDVSHLLRKVPEEYEKGTITAVKCMSGNCSEKLSRKDGFFNQLELA